MKKNKKQTAVETEQVLTEDDLNDIEKDGCECDVCHCAEKGCNCSNGECECGEECQCHMKELEEAIAKQNEYLGLAQQIQADFENYKKRMQDYSKNAKYDGIIFAVEKLLPVVDSIASAKRQIKDEAFLASLDLIYKQTLDCFDRIGVKKIDAVGKPFDPNLHNAVFTEHKDGVEPDVVLDELQEGFTLDGRVVRHSVVKVSE